VSTTVEVVEYAGARTKSTAKSTAVEADESSSEATPKSTAGEAVQYAGARPKSTAKSTAVEAVESSSQATRKSTAVEAVEGSSEAPTSKHVLKEQHVSAAQSEARYASYFTKTKKRPVHRTLYSEGESKVISPTTTVVDRTPIDVSLFQSTR